MRRESSGMQPMSSGRRGRGRPFQKGQSGNPAGRRRVDRDVEEAMQEALAAGHEQLAAAVPEAVQRLVRLVRSENEKIAAHAVQMVLDRAYGRPQQAHTHDVEARGFVAVLPSPMQTPEEWAATFAPQQKAEPILIEGSVQHQNDDEAM